MSVMAEYLRYKDFQNLSDKAKDVFQNATYYSTWEDIIFQAYHQGKDVQTYQTELENFEALLNSAHEVLPTSHSASEFRDEVSKAYSTGQSISDYQFTIETIETISLSQTSPYYADDLAKITQDEQFSDFVEIVEEIDTQNTTTYFTPPVEFTQAVEESIYTVDENISMFKADSQTISKSEALEMAKPTSKTVLNSSDFGVSNPETLLTSDGIMSKSNVTTQNLENERLEELESNISTSTSSEEILDIVSNFNQESQTTTQDTSYVDDFSPDLPSDEINEINFAYSEAIKRLKLEEFSSNDSFSQAPQLDQTADLDQAP